MTDREKVVKGLEICIKNINQVDCPNDCPYYSDCTKYEKRYIFQPLLRDALKLIKEQEPVKPVREFSENIDNCAWWYECGWCHDAVDYHDIFCRHCGRELKWDD